MDAFWVTFFVCSNTDGEARSFFQSGRKHKTLIAPIFSTTYYQRATPRKEPGPAIYGNVHMLYSTLYLKRCHSVLLRSKRPAKEYQWVYQQKSSSGQPSLLGDNTAPKRHLAY